jgi:hypothetical protein
MISTLTPVACASQATKPSTSAPTRSRGALPSMPCAIASSRRPASALNPASRWPICCRASAISSFASSISIGRTILPASSSASRYSSPTAATSRARRRTTSASAAATMRAARSVARIRPARAALG